MCIKFAPYFHQKFGIEKDFFSADVFIFNYGAKFAPYIMQIYSKLTIYLTQKSLRSLQKYNI